MDRIPIQSSNVAEIGYEESTMTLEVMFHGGSIYHYFDVPYMVYSELISAASVGSYLNTNIKEVYRYTRL